MKKQTKNKIYLILGLLPYALFILYLLYSMIFGFYYCSGLFQSANCEKKLWI